MNVLEKRTNELTNERTKATNEHARLTTTMILMVCRLLTICHKLAQGPGRQRPKRQDKRPICKAAEKLAQQVLSERSCVSASVARAAQDTSRTTHTEDQQTGILTANNQPLCLALKQQRRCQVRESAAAWVSIQVMLVLTTVLLLLGAPLRHHNSATKVREERYLSMGE